MKKKPRFIVNVTVEHANGMVQRETIVPGSTLDINIHHVLTDEPDPTAPCGVGRFAFGTVKVFVEPL